MSTSLLIALGLIVLAILLALINPWSLPLHIYFTTFHLKGTIVLLSFFIAGTVVGLLLKGK